MASTIKSRDRIGVVSALRLARGFGFVAVDNVPDELFFHVSELNGGLQFDEQLEQRRVVFDIAECAGRTRATNIRPIKM